MVTNHGGTMYRAERIFDKIINAISIGLVSPAVVALVGWVLVMVVCITFRGLFTIDWMFMEEYTGYFLVLVGSFSLLYTLRSEGHISVDVVTRLLPKTARDILHIVSGLLGLVIVGYLTQKGWVWFEYAWENEIVSQFPSSTWQWPVFLLVPLGFASLGLGLLLHVCQGVLRLISGKNTKEE